MRMLCAAMLVVGLLGSVALGEDEYRVEVSESAPPAEVAKPIAGTLNLMSIKVIKGATREVGQFWFCKEWAALKDFEPTAQVLYPFTPGQLIGVLQLPRKGSDFRDQPIAKGAYTIRYAQQPVDGNHVGTSPTRDFLVLVKAEDDQQVAVIAVKDLMKLSAAAAGSGHPAMLCLQRAGEKPAKLPALRHNEEHDWWIAQIGGLAKGGEKAAPLPVDIVVVGHAAE